MGDQNTNTAEQQQTVGSQKAPSIERDVLKLSQYGMVKLKAQRWSVWCHQTSSSYGGINSWGGRKSTRKSGGRMGIDTIEEKGKWKHKFVATQRRKE